MKVSLFSRIKAPSLCLLLASAICLTLAPTTAWAQGGNQAGSSVITKPPVLLKEVQADYTQEAIDARVEGPVKLKLTIGADGKVVEAKPIEGPGYGLDESAQAAAMQFEFEPAEVNGQPSAIILTFIINFELPILPSSFVGEVLDQESGEGMQGAEVIITYMGEGDFPDGRPTVSAKTDEQGKFSFENMPAGPYKVKLKLDEYRDYETSIETVSGEESSATYKVAVEAINYTGRVREAGTRKILPGITIELTQITGMPDGEDPIVRQEFTDADGRFAFRGLPPGEYNILMDAQGYKSATFIEEVSAGERLEGNYFIEAEFYDEYTIVTSARRERREVSRQTITLQESRRVPGTGGDVVRVVQNLPGVARAPFGAGQLIVRGSNPQDSAVFLQGDEIPIVYHFLAGPAVVNSEMIESLDFYPGNFSPRYGRAIGGILDLNTRQPRDDTYHGFAKVDIQDASVLVEGPITENLSFALSGRRSYVDKVLEFAIPLVVGEEGLGFQVAPYYYDYQGWLTWKGLENNAFELFAYGSRDELRVLLDEPVGDASFQITSLNTEIMFHRLQGRWEWRPDGPLKNELMATGGFINTGFNAGDAFGISNDQWTANIRDDLEVKLAPKATLRAGLDMQFIYSKFELDIPGFGEGDPGGFPNPAADGLNDDGGFAVSYPAYWAELELRPIEKLQILPGVRMDYYSNNTQTTVSPRIASRYKINDKFSAKGGIGLFDQPPDPGNTFPGFGNPDLVSEKAIHYALGGEWRPKQHLEFGVTGFYRDAFDLVSNSSEFTVDEETGDVRFTLFENEGQGRSYGAEFLLRHYPHKRFFGWIAYTLSKSERLNLETDEFEVFDFDQTHILTGVAGYNLPRNFDISVRFRYVTGNPYTPIVGSVFNADEDSYSSVNGPPNSARNAAFNQLDIRLDKSFVFDRWKFGVYLDVQNVYNASNAEGVQYNYDFTESAPVNGIPIFPNLGLTAQF